MCSLINDAVFFGGFRHPSHKSVSSVAFASSSARPCGGYVAGVLVWLIFLAGQITRVLAEVNLGQWAAGPHRKVAPSSSKVIQTDSVCSTKLVQYQVGSKKLEQSWLNNVGS